MIFQKIILKKLRMRDRIIRYSVALSGCLAGTGCYYGVSLIILYSICQIKPKIFTVKLDDG